jgi:hypothetical protein
MNEMIWEYIIVGVVVVLAMTAVIRRLVIKFAGKTGECGECPSRKQCFSDAEKYIKKKEEEDGQKCEEKE